ncbi:hypothetical protein ACP70R_022228 [Stipagrostis hirtigluma subsp. patula]
MVHLCLDLDACTRWNDVHIAKIHAGSRCLPCHFDARVHNGQRRPLGKLQLLPSGVTRLRQHVPPQLHPYHR